MGEKFAEFDQYQLGKHGKKMKKNKIPIDFFGASKDDSDQGNGSNMREWVGLNTKFVYNLRENTLACLIFNCRLKRRWKVSKLT